MNPFKIATWNVNSLRVRLPHLLEWVTTSQPDVIALQETKLMDEKFPTQEIIDAGYVAVFAGQRAYNGVAILSRNKMTDMVTDLKTFVDPQRRILVATIDDIRIINLYVPNGQTVGSEKYQYKLNWLTEIKKFIADELKKFPKLIVLGDFNIAPQEVDVHDPKLWEGKILCSDLERAAFNDLLQLGLVDAFRNFSPSEKIYSWWDYRLNSFKRNLGMRIDHILISKALLNNCSQCYIDKSPRALERPSDHAPVLAEFNF